MTKNRFNTYLLYGVGEIILVVVGILIAVSIDNWNEDRKERKQEIQYLKNIKSDLQKDLKNLEELITFRKQKIMATSVILKSINTQSAENLDSLIWAFSFSMSERKFRPNNTTFSELSNSGNLSLISSDAIKTLLLELTNNYARNAELIEHETFDYRQYISQTIAPNFDLKKHIPIVNGDVSADEMGIDSNDFEALFESLQYKNGIFIIYSMSEAFIDVYQEMSEKSNRIIDLIDHEMKKK